MLNESLFIKKLQAGDNRAFQELIKEFEPRLSRVAKLLTANEQETEELVSDTFVGAFFSIKRFKQESSLFSWLYSILLNKFYYRLGRRKREVAFKFSFKQIAKTIKFSDRDEEKRVLFRQYLPDLLNRLSRDHKEVVLLKFLEQMKIKEITKILKIPESTVKMRLQRAIINFRKILKESDFLPDDSTY